MRKSDNFSTSPTVGRLPPVHSVSRAVEEGRCQDLEEDCRLVANVLMERNIDLFEFASNKKNIASDLAERLNLDSNQTKILQAFCLLERGTIIQLFYFMYSLTKGSLVFSRRRAWPGRSRLPRFRGSSRQEDNTSRQRPRASRT